MTPIVKFSAFARATGIPSRHGHGLMFSASVVRSLRAVRPMSSSPGKHLFLVYAPDKTDEGAFQRRLSVRSQHLEGAFAQNKNGVLKLGGAMLTPESISSPDAVRTLTGSTLIYSAPSLEEVRKLVESDVYYTAGVWDREKLVITPFAVATPFP